MDDRWPSLRLPRRPWAKAAAVATILAIAATVALARDAPSIATFDDGPQGYAGAINAIARAGTPISTLQTGPYLLEDLAAPRTTAILITGIDRPLTDGETRAFHDFTQHGGRVVIATTNPNVNSLTQRFHVRIEGHHIISQNGALDLESRDQQTFHMEHASALLIDEDARPHVLLRAPTNTFLDMNNDEHVDAFDRSGPFVVAATFPTENGGSVSVIAGNSFLTNQHLDLTLLDHMLGDLNAEGRAILVYEGAHPHQPQLLYTTAEILQTATRHPVYQIATILLVIALVAIILLFHKGPPSLEHVYAGQWWLARPLARDGLLTALKQRIGDRARERVGMSAQEFASLSTSERSEITRATLEGVDPNALNEPVYHALHAE